MENEKYGIELELITDKFNKQINKVKKEVNSVSKVKRLEEYSDISKAPVSAWKQWASQNQKVNESVKRMKINFKGLQPIADKFTTSTEKGLKKVTSNIKRFGLSLLGIRSIWAIASRASSAYLSQNTELSNRLQSAWAGLGALLSPIIEGLINLFAKAVKYVAIFFKALTGVDLLAKATAKSLNKTAGSAKGLNKALVGFDELTNLDTDAGGGADIGAGLGGLEDVEIDTKWADRIEKFGNWMKTNWTKVLGLFTGTVTAIKAIGAGVGVVKSLGLGALIGGIVYSVSSLLGYLKDNTWKNFGQIIQGIGVAIAGLGVIIASVPVIVSGAVTLIVGTVVKYWEQIRSFLQGGIDWLTSKVDWVRDHFGVVGQTIYTIFTSLLQGLLNIFDSVFTAIKGVFDGIIKFVKGVFTGNWREAWQGIKDIFSSVWNGIKGIVSAVVNTIKSILQGLLNTVKTIVIGIWNAIKAVINAITGGINVLIRGINKIKFDVPDWVPGIGGQKWGFNIPQIPQLYVGTNYVPEDQLAMIHKGEAVVPKKFNSKEYFGDNDETNSLLRQVIEAVNNIEINPYTTVKDVGKASLSYINSKSRQLGESVVY